MVIKDFNLLISSPRRLETEACIEIWFLLGEIGDCESHVERTGISGLIIASTLLNEFKVVENLRIMFSKKPWEFRYIHRIIPIEIVVRTSLEEIKDASLRISNKIAENETFRVTLEKRHTNLTTKKVVEEVAKGIDRKVDLDNPDKIILVEIFGGLSGVSIIKPDQILSVMKEKSTSSS